MCACRQVKVASAATNEEKTIARLGGRNFTQSAARLSPAAVVVMIPIQARY